MNGQQRLESFGTKARFAFWFRAKNLFSSVDFFSKHLVLDLKDKVNPDLKTTFLNLL